MEQIEIANIFIYIDCIHKPKWIDEKYKCGMHMIILIPLSDHNGDPNESAFPSNFKLIKTH